MNSNGVTGTLDTLIIGGGQAGLALGHYLKAQNRTFQILDANPRTGDAWRQRWDSLRVFTPAKFDGLPGAPFPGDPLYFPTKDDIAGYLEGYAARFDLPVASGVRVDRLWRESDRFIAASNGHRWEASNVVVATGSTQTPKVPGFAADLGAAVVQVHSGEYRNPGQLQDGPVLVVGLGNSGAEIAQGSVRYPYDLRRRQAHGGASGQTWPGRGALRLPFGAPHRTPCAHAGYADRAQVAAGNEGSCRAPDPDEDQAPGRRRRQSGCSRHWSAGRASGP